MAEMTQRRKLRATHAELKAGLFQDFLAGVPRETSIHITSYFAGDQRDQGTITLEVDVDNQYMDH